MKPRHLPKPEMLISERRIRMRVSELGREISSCYREGNLTVVFVSNGAAMFASDLIRKMDLPIRLDSICASSYSGSKSSGRLEMRSSVKLDIRGEHVLLVDDILDTGLTLGKLITELDKSSPADIRLCVLLDKPSCRKNQLKADHVGFEIPDMFVVGYGLDYNEYYRNLPYVGFIRNTRNRRKTTG